MDQPLLNRVELTQKVLVEERMKAIAAQLIAAHRRNRHDLVLPYARQAGLVLEGQAPHHLFMKTIQVFHPDRLTLVWDRIHRAVQSSDQRELEALTQFLRLHPDPHNPARVVEDFEDEEETYGFDEEDFGFDVHEEEWDEDLEPDWDDDSNTFYGVVKREMFGSLELYPSAVDLGRIEGELDLSDRDLDDLEGIEYCRGLTALNLSRNNLDNLYCLKDLIKLETLDLAENDLEDADDLGGLVNLRELDLSANEIEDVAFLDRLTNLVYVDLTGNPVRNKAVLARLEARGVIVIL
jgi:hypothetical protein